MKQYKRILNLITIAFIFLALLIINVDTVGYTKAKYKTYSISPNSLPLDNSRNNPSYNKYTKHFFLIRSYLIQLENEGGGTLVLEKGTYNITNSLYITSNTTIILNNGVKIKKGDKTEVTALQPALSIFQCVSPSKSKINKVHSKYNGEKNIKIIGKGNATIDLCNVEGAMGIILGHNKNVEISNITFKNSNIGHFIETAATNGLTIKDNRFIDSKEIETNTGYVFNKEAIGLDTPDSETNGFPFVWSNDDNFPNKNVLIENNEFENLDRAIGTHKYSQNKDSSGNYTINQYHSNIIIRNNSFNKMRSDAIRIMNWKNATIENNTIVQTNTHSLSQTSKSSAILISGGYNITIINNTFKNLFNAIMTCPWRNNASGSIYSEITNKLTDENIDNFNNNTFNNVENHTIFK